MRPRVLEYKTRDKGAPFPVVWVQTYGPATNNIISVVKVANSTIGNSETWKDVQKPIGVVNRRGRNIGEMVLKRKRFALEDSSSETEGTVRCTAVVLPGQRNTKRGRPCESCNLMSGNNSITSTVTSKTYQTPKGCCKSKCLIYCAQCVLCKKQYTGKTDVHLGKRICTHRTHVNNLKTPGDEETDESALADHLRADHNLFSVEDFSSHYLFTILEVEPANLDTCEQKWTNRLVTMRPFGLNIEKPGGVADTITTMSQKQALSQR